VHLVVLQWILPEGNGPAEWAERSARAEWQCCERDYIDCDRDRDRERGLRCKIWRARFSKTIGRHQVAASQDAHPRDSFGKLDKLAAECCCCCSAPYGQMPPECAGELVRAAVPKRRLCSARAALRRFSCEPKGARRLFARSLSRLPVTPSELFQFVQIAWLARRPAKQVAETRFGG